MNQEKQSIRSKEPRFIWRKENLLTAAMLLIVGIAAFVFNQLFLSTHNEIFVWAARIALVALPLVFLSPIVMQRWKKKEEQERQASPS